MVGFERRVWAVKGLVSRVGTVYLGQLGWGVHVGVVGFPRPSISGTPFFEPAGATMWIGFLVP